MSRFRVSFKTETYIYDEPCGPVQIIDLDKYEADPVIVERKGIPYGYKPNGVAELGWLPRSQALSIAAAHGVPLTES